MSGKAKAEQLSNRLNDLKACMGSSGEVADKEQFQKILDEINALYSELMADDAQGAKSKAVADAQAKIPPMARHDHEDAKATLPPMAGHGKGANPDVVKRLQSRVAELVPDANARERLIATLLKSAGTLARFGKAVDAAKDLLTADSGNISILPQFKEIMDTINTLAGEIVQDYGDGNFGLGTTTQPGSVDMGQSTMSKPVETWSEGLKGISPDTIQKKIAKAVPDPNIRELALASLIEEARGRR